LTACGEQHTEHPPADSRSLLASHHFLKNKKERIKNGSKRKVIKFDGVLSSAVRPDNKEVLFLLSQLACTQKLTLSWPLPIFHCSRFLFVLTCFWHQLWIIFSSATTVKTGNIANVP
jgi:hypothetical protein